LWARTNSLRQVALMSQISLTALTMLDRIRWHPALSPGTKPNQDVAAPVGRIGGTPHETPTLCDDGGREMFFTAAHEVLKEK
jgi:hypothetical protein